MPKSQSKLVAEPEVASEPAPVGQIGWPESISTRHHPPGLPRMLGRFCMCALIWQPPATRGLQALDMWLL